MLFCKTVSLKMICTPSGGSLTVQSHMQAKRGQRQPTACLQNWLECQVLLGQGVPRQHLKAGTKPSNVVQNSCSPESARIIARAQDCTRTVLKRCSETACRCTQGVSSSASAARNTCGYSTSFPAGVPSTSSCTRRQQWQTSTDCVGLAMFALPVHSTDEGSRRVQKTLQPGLPVLNQSSMVPAWLRVACAGASQGSTSKIAESGVRIAL